MTGLEPREDVILEVAAIATDWSFKEIATFEGVVKQPRQLIDERMAIGKAFWDANPEARDGLVAQNEQGEPSKQIEQQLIDFIEQHFDTETKVLLAGNSIHQDRQFINFWWPKLAARLHYRMLDVSAWKLVFEGKYKKKFAKPEEHRALGDIRGSIMELKYYLTKVHAGR